MAKSGKNVDTSGQLSLLEYLTQRRKEKLAGDLNIQFQVRECVSRMLKGAPVSRYGVAARMSELAGVNISKFMLDAWSAESKQYHRFPCEFVPALCEATGSTEILDILGRKAGIFCVPGPDALRSEIQRLEEEISTLKAERRKRLLFLKELGGRA